MVVCNIIQKLAHCSHRLFPSSLRRERERESLAAGAFLYLPHTSGCKRKGKYSLPIVEVKDETFLLSSLKLLGIIVRDFWEGKVS